MNIKLNNVEDYYVAEALYELASIVENDDILDKVYEGEEKSVEVKGDHFTATIERE